MKLTRWLHAFVLFFSAVTLSSAEKPETRIVTSFYPMYVAVLNITAGIPGVSVTNMTNKVTGCLHDYQLTPDDMKTLSNADIFVVNGAGMESFLEKAIRERKSLKIVDASEGIELLKTDNVPNPHIWVSISLHIRQIKNISEALAKLDPSKAEAYRKNASAYIGRLEKLRGKMLSELKDIKNRDIITFHEAFPYFAKEFNLNIAAVLEREPGSEPNARELAQAIDLIRKTKVKAIFTEPQYSAKSAETIARETTAKVYILDPAVTGPLEPDAYIKIMEKNLEVLKKALE